MKNNKESYLSPREIKELLENIQDNRDRLMLRVLYETGCELKELVEFKVSDILGNKMIVRSNIRYPQISAKLSKDLRAFIVGNNLQKESKIFSTRQGKGISEKRIRQLIHEYSLRTLKKKINPQIFRYLHIAHAYLAGVNLESIANQIGITTFRIFQIIDQLKLKPSHNYNIFLKRV